tara:strand:- start:629 stop:1309 length:681 start_codon:yes stop_codon:yes gene_type:complete
MKKKLPLNGPSFEPANKPQKLVFLLHGYGDNGENFVSLARDIYDSNFNINFFAPNAPSTIPQYPVGRQWFDLYPNGINFNEAGPEEKLIMQEDCLSSVKLIKDYIKNKCKKFDLTFKDCFILGFSQGAMMTFEAGKYIDKTLGGCILLSGRILPSENHKNKLFSKTPLLIIHGDQDTVLKPEYFYEACEILKNHGYLYDSHLMKYLDHSISPKIIQLIKNFIKKNV